MTRNDDEIREAARVAAENGLNRNDCDISSDAPVNEADGGFWVTAYIWVPEEDEEGDV